jgi:hypothetical protein
MNEDRTNTQELPPWKTCLLRPTPGAKRIFERTWKYAIVPKPTLIPEVKWDFKTESWVSSSFVPLVPIKGWQRVFLNGTWTYLIKYNPRNRLFWNAEQEEYTLYNEMETINAITRIYEELHENAGDIKGYIKKMLLTTGPFFFR